ncbi:hypothetical protein [Streptomyces cirratus]|uniref:hypothetical protein n=1 Tax=Streptomyces cirratus TaxID=68187 RepID=UPI0036198C1A
MAEHHTDVEEFLELALARGTPPSAICSSRTPWASSCFEEKWKYRAPLVTPARARMSAIVAAS